MVVEKRNEHVPDNEGLDFHSLMGTGPAAPVSPVLNASVPEGPPEDTGFHTLMKEMGVQRRPLQYRSATDYLIDVLTPLILAVMMYSVIYFLLDVRFIYTEASAQNLQLFAFFFIMGIIALNRLIARDGREESYLYVFALIGVVGLYSFSVTGEVGSVARGFMDDPYFATVFNVSLAVFLWWLTNRLMHECSIDENKTAGDIGILTGTARRFQRAAQPKEKRPKPPKRKKDASPFVNMEIEAVDPLDWKPPEDKPSTFEAAAPHKRLQGRHPGISIFYFSVPVMFLFAVGLRVLGNGGEAFIKTGYFYVVLYTISALSLLMLTSLGGLREYFRSRRVRFPAGIGWFWIGLGTVMIATVCFAAKRLPPPHLPPIAYVDEHETDFWTRGSNFELQSAGASAVRILDESRFMDRVGTGVLIGLGLFFGFAALRGLSGVAAFIGRHRHRFPAFVVRGFNRLDRLLQRLIKVPSLPKLKRARKISRALATSAAIDNPLLRADPSNPAEVQQCVAVSYEALCALARDMGVPRQEGQTPYEFVDSFPKRLNILKEEALELTDLYVRSAYSPETMDERALDRLRKFWISYTKVRKRVIR